MKEFLNSLDDAVIFGVMDQSKWQVVRTRSIDAGSVYFPDILGLLMASQSTSVQQAPPHSRAKSLYGTLLTKQNSASNAVGISSVECCKRAELRLLKSLGIDSDFLHKDCSKISGPIVYITKDGKPVALQKNVGKPSVYALVTDRNLGLVERTFSEPSRKIEPDIIKTDSPVVRIDAVNYGTFRPQRLAASVFSEETKDHVVPYVGVDKTIYDAFMAFDHKTIVDAATTVFDNGHIESITFECIIDALLQTAR